MAQQNSARRGAGIRAAAIVMLSLPAAACGGSGQQSTTSGPASGVAATGAATATGGTATGTATTAVSSAHAPTAASGSASASAAAISQTGSGAPHPGAASAVPGANGAASGGGSASGPSAIAPHLLRVTERAHITGVRGPYIFERGVVSGSPGGQGTVVLRARLTASGAIVSFTVTDAAGSVSGLASARLRITGTNVRYRGSARLTGGTGRYRRVRAPALSVAGSGDLAGRQTVLHVTGLEQY